MIKILGLILIVTSCSMMGFSMYREMVLRCNALKMHIAALQLIRTEIAYRNTPFDAIVELVARDCGQATALFYQKTFADTLSGLAFSSAAQQHYEKLERQGLSKEDIESIRGACRVLGQYDSMTQSEGIAASVSQLENNLLILQKEMASKGQVYKTAGATIGVVLALIVI